MEMTNNAIEFTDRNVKQCHPRLAGTLGCKKAAENIHNELKENCDLSFIQPFIYHEAAHISFLKIMAIGTIIIMICSILEGFWLYIATAIYFIGNIFAWGEFVFYNDLFDRLFPKKTGYNVVGTINPSRDVTQQIVIAGHHDACWNFNFMEHHQPIYALRIILGVGSFLFLGGLVVIWSIIQIFGGHVPFYASLLPYILLVSLFFTTPLFFFVSKKITPGAGDNLIACAIVIQLAKLFKKQKNFDLTLSNTKLIFLSTDAEEQGLRGAKAFLNAHEKEFQKYPTYVINIDSIYKLKDLNCFTSDLNGFCKTSKTVAQDCSKIAKSLGYSMPAVKFSFGGGATDSAEYGRRGFDSTCIVGIPVTAIREEVVYHTHKDTIEMIEPQSVDAIFKIIISYIIQKDSMDKFNSNN